MNVRGVFEGRPWLGTLLASALTFALTTAGYGFVWLSRLDGYATRVPALEETLRRIDNDGTRAMGVLTQRVAELERSHAEISRRLGAIDEAERKTENVLNVVQDRQLRVLSALEDIHKELRAHEIKNK